MTLTLVTAIKTVADDNKHHHQVWLQKYWFRRYHPDKSISSEEKCQFRKYHPDKSIGLEDIIQTKVSVQKISRQKYQFRRYPERGLA